MEKTFTIELDRNDSKIELHLNKAGAEYLKDLLDRLISCDQNQDIHLMSPNWGGNELSDEQQNLSPDIELLNHLKILYWKE